MKSPGQTCAIVERRVLRDGGWIVELKVPPVKKVPEENVVDFGSYPDNGTDVQYLHFPRFVRGGAVHLFVRCDHAKPPTDRRIKAKMVVMYRRSVDGEEMVYLDFFPLPDDTVATHRLLILGRDDPALAGGGFETIDLPKFRGTVIAIGAPKPERERKPSVEHKAKPVVATSVAAQQLEQRFKVRLAKSK